MNNFLVVVDGFSPLIIVKVLLVIGVLVYSLFALLMVRQISLMGGAIKMRDDYVIQVVGIAHLVYTLLVLVITLLV